MASFYSDAEMKTMKSEDDFKAAWMALKPEDREKVSKECDSDSEKLHNDFCEKTKQLGGATSVVRPAPASGAVLLRRSGIDYDAWQRRDAPHAASG